MKQILKMRWFIVGVWIAATIVLAIFQPNLNKIINERGQQTVGNDAPSKIAEGLLNEITKTKGDTGLIVFYDKNKLSEAEINRIQIGIKGLRDNMDNLGIISMVDPFSTTEAKAQLITKDKTTLLVSVTYSKKDRNAEEVRLAFESKLGNVGVKHYVTGGTFISNDFLKATNKGVDKSSVITVVFILLVLIIVFRSVITPIISLLAVGIAYICSMGIVGQLIDKFNFPVTSLTQMFLILILFGIGTDYNILLFNRFKEELGHTDSIDEAIVATYKTAGKTIIYSGLTVFMAFASLSFVKFGVYRSGNAVAIGIMVLLLELLTLTPFLMKIVGNKLFWPSHETKGHKESKLWEKVTYWASHHPVISLVVVFVIIAPVIIFNNQKLSFDNMKDIGSGYQSVEGFNIVKAHAGKGKAMPTTVVIKSEKPMDNNQALAIIDGLTEKIKNVKGVVEVSGPTQPTGAQIDSFYTSKQTKTVVSGLTAAGGGVDKIYGGLKQINDKLAAPDFSSVNSLVSGTGIIQVGLTKIGSALEQVKTGISKGADGAGTISKGINVIKKNLDLISKSTNQVLDGYSKLQAGYTIFGDNYKNIAQQLTGIQQGLAGMQGLTTALEANKNYSGLNSDPSFLGLKKLVGNLSDGLNKLSSGIQALNSNFEKTNTSFAMANEGLKKLNGGQSQLVQGLNQLEIGSKGLFNGLKKGAAGQELIVQNMSKLTDGVGKIKDGQAKLYNGLNTLSSGMGKLKDGIGASAKGLKAISSGIGKTNGFLTQLSTSKSFFIPKEAFETAGFNKALDAYMSKDRKIVKLVVNLEADPYTDGAIKTVGEINTIVSNHLKGTILSDAIVGVAGESSSTNDVDKTSTGDITFTQIIVLLSIFILLIFVIKSFWIPLYIVFSLVISYYTAISVTGFLTLHLLKVDGISWNVPFFSFVVIAALGVDYSIFLMTRFKEYKGIPMREAMIKAASNIGGVVMSAAIILAGTFATLYPAGLHTLMELAISVDVGLLMLSLILLPIVIPAMMSLPDAISSKIHKSSVNM